MTDKHMVESNFHSNDVADLKNFGDSYWEEDLSSFTDCNTTPLKSVDVLVIGSGYTGLHAALITARADRTTQVIETNSPGWGCSTRNGGQISPSIKLSLAELSKKYGAEKALAIRKEGYASLEWIEEFVKAEDIDCDFQRNGRFNAAHTPQHFIKLVQEAEQLSKEEGFPSVVVTRAEQRNELGTDTYHGGVIFTRNGMLHPAKYHAGLLKVAQQAGVAITGNCSAENIKPKGDVFVVDTPKGEILAKKIIIATNGYTTDLVPWLKRRVIPVGTYMIATEPLPKSVMDRLFPKNRAVVDTCKIVYYYRSSPDRTRVLFGGRVSADEIDPSISGPILKRDMCRIFPELENCKLTHSWTGTVAFSFDKLMHIGQHKGIHYAMGYCGSGVAMASYLGMRLGQQSLGEKIGSTAFDNLKFQTRPFYTGRPWFLPAMVRWYRWRDQRQIQSAAKN
jgi:glycine/D-amino acid oxidase-like deaminating enzyme|tara:strand:- start:247 stop:1596 length:1350 start_codon:yes stop_codon:yes gene_type:complete